VDAAILVVISAIYRATAS